MTTQEAREVFDLAAKNAADADQVARIELLREYFTNADFRASLEQKLWEAAR